MADQVQLDAQPRDETGSGVSRRLRARGRIPAVVYGSGVESRPLHVDSLDLYHALHTPAGLNALINLQVDGDVHLTLARELQRHPVRGDLYHVDFVALDPEERIRVEIPVRLHGAEKVAAPGVVTQILHSVPILVRPMDIPDGFDLEVGDMVMGDVQRVSDIDLPADGEFDIEIDRTVVTVSAPTEIEEEEEEEVPAALADLMEGFEGEELTEEELAERLEEAREAAEEAGEEFEGIPEEIAEGEPEAEEGAEAEEAGDES